MKRIKAKKEGRSEKLTGVGEREREIQPRRKEHEMVDPTIVFSPMPPVEAWKFRIRTDKCSRRR